MTPFLVCCASGREDFLDVLLQHASSAAASSSGAGSLQNARDDSGRTAAEVATFYGHETLAQYLSRGSGRASDEGKHHHK